MPLNDGQKTPAKAQAGPTRFTNTEHQAVWDEIIRAVGPNQLSTTHNYLLELSCYAVCRLRMSDPNPELEKSVQWLLGQNGLEFEPVTGIIRLAQSTTPGSEVV